MRKSSDINKKELFIIREAFFMEIKSLSSSEAILQPATQKNTATIEKKHVFSKQDEKIPDYIEKKEKPQEEEVKKALNDFNKFLSNSNTHLEYEFHEDLEEYYVKLVSDQTKEVIKEIPSKKLLDVHAAIKEYLGVFVDKKI